MASKATGPCSNSRDVRSRDRALRNRVSGSAEASAPGRSTTSCTIIQATAAPNTASNETRAADRAALGTAGIVANSSPRHIAATASPRAPRGPRRRFRVRRHQNRRAGCGFPRHRRCSRPAAARRQEGRRPATRNGLRSSRRPSTLASEHSTRIRSARSRQLCHQHEVAVLHRRCEHSAPGGGWPIMRWRPSPVRHETRRAGVGRSANHTRPAASAANSAGESVEGHRAPVEDDDAVAQSASTSSVMCVDSTTQRRRRAEISWRNRRRCSGSRPTVGSSSTSRRPGRRAGPGQHDPASHPTRQLADLRRAHVAEIDLGSSTRRTSSWRDCAVGCSFRIAT